MPVIDLLFLSIFLLIVAYAFKNYLIIQVVSGSRFQSKSGIIKARKSFFYENL